MPRAVTLAQLRADVRYRADIENMTARHPDATVNRHINESWQHLREKVSDVGYHTYLKAAAGTLTAGPVAPFSFSTITLPIDCSHVYGIDITVAATDIRSLQPLSWNERNSFRDPYGSNTGIPFGFHVYNIGTESAASVTAGTAALLPAASQGFPYVVWYLPAWNDVTSDSNVFDGVAGWEEWVVWDAVTKVSAKDNDMQQCYAIAVAERDRVWADVQRSAANIQRAGPMKRVDIAGRNRANRMDAYWRRP